MAKPHLFADVPEDGLTLETQLYTQRLEDVAVPQDYKFRLGDLTDFLTEEGFSQKTAELIVICGESNSSGAGRNVDVTSSLLEINESVQVFNPISSEFEALNIGVNNIFNSVGTDWDLNHGLELAIKNHYRQYLLSSEVYIVKGGQGSSRITQWLGATTYYEPELITNRIRPAIAELESRGLKPRITVIWSQGVNDIIDGNTPEFWKNNTQAFFTQLRNDIGDVPIIMTKLPRDDYNTTIEEIAAADPLTYYIESSTHKLQDNNHWGYLGLREIGINALRKISDIRTKESVGGEEIGVTNRADMYVNGTGAVLIKTDLDMPVGAGERIMMASEISAFDYLEEVVTELKISSFLEETTGVSTGGSYYSTDDSSWSKKVRVGQIDGKLCYILGEITTAWTFTSVSFKPSTAHRFSGQNLTEKVSSASIELVTDLTGVTSMRTPEIRGNLNDFIAKFSQFSTSATGAIVLKTAIPKGTPVFIKVVAHVFEQNKQYDISAGCYAYASAITWGSVASNHTEDIGVTWAYSSDNFLVAIFEDVTKVWNYPSVSFELEVESFSGGDMYYDHQNTLWTTSLVTSLTGYTNLHTSNYVAPLPFTELWESDGSNALMQISDNDNIIIGLSAGANLSGTRNVLLGDNAGKNNTGSNNFFAGWYAGHNSIGSNNIFIGSQAGQLNTTGNSNVGLGVLNLASNTTGVGNFAAGLQSLRRNTIGSYNTSLGYFTGSFNTTGSFNVFDGYYAGNNNTTGSNNFFLGRSAGQFNTTGASNVYVGAFAGQDGIAVNSNLMMGQYSGANNITGSNNTYLGPFAGQNNTAGSGGVYIGYSAGYNETNSNRLYIDNSSTTTPLIYGEFDNNLFRINGSLEVTSKTGTATNFAGWQGNKIVDSGVSLASVQNLWTDAGTYLTSNGHDITAEDVNLTYRGTNAISLNGRDSSGWITDVVIGSGLNLDPSSGTLSATGSSQDLTWNSLSNTIGITGGSSFNLSSINYWSRNGSFELFSLENVGIGNINPAFKLDVTGNLRVTTDLYLGRHLYDSNGSAGLESMVLGRDSGGAVWKNNTFAATKSTTSQVITSSSTTVALGSLSETNSMTLSSNKIRPSLGGGVYKATFSCQLTNLAASITAILFTLNIGTGSITFNKGIGGTGSGNEVTDFSFSFASDVSSAQDIYVTAQANVAGNVTISGCSLVISKIN